MVEKFSYDDRAKLSDEWRREHLDPQGFWRRVGLAPGAVVVDVGAGTGYFALPAARLVGPTGRVYGCDVSPEMVVHLRREAEAAGLSQLEALRSEEHRLPLPDASVDLALTAFVLHEVEDPYELLQELRRVLKPAGRLVVIDWLPDVPWPEDLPRRQRWAPSTVRYMLRRAGFNPRLSSRPNEANYLIQAVVDLKPAREGRPGPAAG